MNEHDLFQAIGSAEDDLLLEIDRPQVRRLPRRIGLIAAMLALAVLTACAAPVIWEAIAIENARVVYVGEHQSYIHHFKSNETQPFAKTPFLQSHYQVEMDIAVSDDLPDAIETAYLPTYVPEDWEPAELVIMDNPYDVDSIPKLAATWELRSEDGAHVRVISFEQMPLTFYDPEDPVVHWFYTLTSAEVESQIISIQDMDVLEVAYPDQNQPIYNEWNHSYSVSPYPGARFYYWSDGVYLFSLRVAYETDVSVVESVISSIAVADLGEIPVVE